MPQEVTRRSAYEIHTYHRLYHRGSGSRHNACHSTKKGKAPCDGIKVCDKIGDCRCQTSGGGQDSPAIIEPGGGGSGKKPIRTKCRVGLDCAKGELCLEGFCRLVPPCSSATDCPANNLICSNGMCQVPSGACWPVVMDGSCLSGARNTAAECSNQVDWPEQANCVFNGGAGHCARRCASDLDCCNPQGSCDLETPYDRMTPNGRRLGICR